MIHPCVEMSQWNPLSYSINVYLKVVVVVVGIVVVAVVVKQPICIRFWRCIDVETLHKLIYNIRRDGYNTLALFCR